MFLGVDGEYLYGEGVSWAKGGGRRIKGEF